MSNANANLNHHNHASAPTPLLDLSGGNSNQTASGSSSERERHDFPRFAPRLPGRPSSHGGYSSNRNITRRRQLGGGNLRRSHSDSNIPPNTLARLASQMEGTNFGLGYDRSSQPHQNMFSGSMHQHPSNQQRGRAAGNNSHHAISEQHEEFMRLCRERDTTKGIAHLSGMQQDIWAQRIQTMGATPAGKTWQELSVLLGTPGGPGFEHGNSMLEGSNPTMLGFDTSINDSMMHMG